MATSHLVTDGCSATMILNNLHSFGEMSLISLCYLFMEIEVPVIFFPLDSFVNIF